MKGYVTTVLDAIGLILLAFGFAAATYHVLGYACLAVAGTIILLGSWIAARDPKHKGVNE